jgi:hypothetical protein
MALINGEKGFSCAREGEDLEDLVNQNRFTDRWNGAYKWATPGNP